MLSLPKAMAESELHYNPPGRLAAALNRAFGWLTAHGIGPSDSFLLQVEGRKSGKRYATPVNVLTYTGKSYLVGTRGHTQWSRNALAVGIVTLRRGQQEKRFYVHALPDHEKPAILKAYLMRFNWMVWRFFPVSKDAPVSAFANLTAIYPAFELLDDSSIKPALRKS